MSKIKIGTDSTADIPRQLAKELEIAVLPLTIIINDQEYKDGIDISTDEFYHILETEEKLPVSSQVAVPLYTELFEKTWQEGYTDLIHVSINAKGSGTYQAGILAKNMFFDEHKEAEGKFQIHLIDSTTYSMAYGWAVVEAARMAKKGAEVEEIIGGIKEWLDNVWPLFVPLTLKCVKKSGRISAAAALVGEALGIKPIITFEGGEAKIVEKVRGEKKAIKRVIELLAQEMKPGTPYILVYGNNMEEYNRFKEKCIEVTGKEPDIEYPVGNVISINTGPNMVSVIFRR